MNDPESHTSSATDTSLTDRRSTHSNASTSASDPNVRPVGHDNNSGDDATLDGHHVPNQAPQKLETVFGAMQQFPMQTVAAMNTILFERHGYSRMQCHGNPR